MKLSATVFDHSPTYAAILWQI